MLPIMVSNHQRESGCITECVAKKVENEKIHLVLHVSSSVTGHFLSLSLSYYTVLFGSDSNWLVEKRH